MPNAKILFLDLDNTLTDGHTHNGLVQMRIMDKFPSGLVSNGKQVSTFSNGREFANTAKLNEEYNEQESIAATRTVFQGFGGLKNAKELCETCALAHSNGYKICIVTANKYPDAVELVRDELIKETNAALAGQGKEANTAIDYVSGFPLDEKTASQSKNQQLETAARTLYGVDLRNPEQAANCTYIDDSKKFISSAEKEFPGIVSITAPAKGVPGTAYLLEAQQNIKETVERERVAELEEEPMYVNLPGGAASTEHIYENFPVLETTANKRTRGVRFAENAEVREYIPEKQFTEVAFQLLEEDLAILQNKIKESSGISKELNSEIKKIDQDIDSFKKSAESTKKSTDNPTELLEKLKQDIKFKIEATKKQETSGRPKAALYAALHNIKGHLYKIVHTLSGSEKYKKASETEFKVSGGSDRKNAYSTVIEGYASAINQLNKMQTSIQHQDITPSASMERPVRTHTSILKQRREAPIEAQQQGTRR